MQSCRDTSIFWVSSAGEERFSLALCRFGSLLAVMNPTLPLALIVLSLGALSLRGVEEEKRGEPMKILMQFNGSRTELEWVAINDGVMGGLSQGTPAVSEGSLFFTGKLSLENNGGFSSVRASGDFDFDGKTALTLRVRGDGRTYQLRLSTEAMHNGSPVS